MSVYEQNGNWYCQFQIDGERNLNVIKDRKRIKPFESWENCCRISKSDLRNLVSITT